jgi:hypothetical protein
VAEGTLDADDVTVEATKSAPEDSEDPEEQLAMAAARATVATAVAPRRATVFIGSPGVEIRFLCVQSRRPELR